MEENILNVKSSTKSKSGNIEVTFCGVTNKKLLGLYFILLVCFLTAFSNIYFE